MKIIQLNCWAGNLIHPLLSFMKEEAPDIFCTQEILDSQPAANRLYYSYQGLTHIKQAGDFEYVSFAPTWATDAFGQKLSFGNAVFSKLPITDSRTTFINSQYHYPQSSGGFVSNIRNILICTIQAERNITIANHHGFHNINPMGTSESLASSQKIANELSKVGRPLIFCGDLNIIKESPAFEPIIGLGLRNLVAESGVKTTLSHIHEAPNKDSVVCDYILCSSEISVNQFRVSDELVSDHKALILEFAI